MSRIRIAASLSLILTGGLSAQVSTDTARIDPVVVTATRNPLAIGDIPASVTVLQGADLRARGVTSVVEALREVPGVAFARSGSFGGVTSVFVRGGQSTYTKVLIDGVPMNQPGGFFDWSTLSVDNVERIEVVRGPSSVVWGSDAVTGVVNIITRSGRGGPRLLASVRGGSYGTVDGEAQVSHSSTAATYSLGLAHHRTDGIYEFNNRNGSTIFSGRADAALSEKTDGSFSIRYSDNVAHYPTDGSGQPVDSNAFSSSSQLAINARLRRLLTSRFGLQGAVAASTHDGGTDDAESQGGTGYFQTFDHIARRSAELRGVATLAGGTVLTLGGQTEQQLQRSHSQSSFSNSVFAEKRLNHAGFAELVNASARSTVTVGGRVDGNEKFGTFATYRASGQVEVLPATRLRASVGTSFREPAFSETFTTHTAFSRGNPDLSPERAESWEVGVSYGDAVEIRAAYFDQRFADLIDYNGGAVAPAPNYENIARARSRGVEVELSHPPVYGVFFGLSATRLDTKVVERGFSASPTAALVEGQPLLRRPKATASARVGYVGISNLRADVVATYVGERDDRRFNPDFTTTALTLPAYTLVDLSGEYVVSVPADRPGLSLTVRAANLLDTAYESVAGYLAPGRTLLIGGRVTR